MFVPFRYEDETPEQAFHRLQNEGLLIHHKKMLEAKKKKIDEARKELEDGSKSDEEDDDGGGLQIKGDLMNTSYNFTRTLTLLTWKQESPCLHAQCRPEACVRQDH